MILPLLVLIQLLLLSISNPMFAIVLPNRLDGKQPPSVILKPKKSIISSLHYGNHINNVRYNKERTRKNERDNGKVNLPARMIKNLPKNRQAEFMEKELKVTPSQERIHQKGTPLVMKGPSQSYYMNKTNYVNTNSQQPQLVTIPDDTPKYNSNLKVLFYDPSSLQGNIPSHIFDKYGNEIDLSGQSVLLVPPEGGSLEPTSSPKVIDESLSAPFTTEQNIYLDRTKLARSHPKDNMILFGTVLTMAVFVGALTGKRIRKNCNFLKYFIESEGEEDCEDDRENILMGRDYDTFRRHTGDIRWRGDLEKFDV